MDQQHTLEHLTSTRTLFSGPLFMNIYPEFITDEITPPLSLTLVERLFACLNQRDITYCHWKSNNAIERSFTGENDLDLLIDRRQSQAFNILLSELGFKRAIASLPRQFPGIEDFYGFDEVSGKLVHVHVHYQLVVGEIYLKSVHIPLEQDVLKTRRQAGSVMMPAPEYELFLFVLRMVLRIRWVDVLRGRPQSLKMKEELTYLMMGADMDHLQKILHRYKISEVLFADLLNAIENGTSGWRWLRLQAKLRRELKPFWRMGTTARFFTLAFRKLFIRVNLLRYGRIPKKNLYSGGFSIALVGSDGSGKSTLVQSLKDWLGSVNDMQTFHMGKPKPSFATLGVNKAVGLARLLGLMQKNPSSAAKEKLSVALMLLQGYCLARDRYRTFSAIRGVVGQGHIAIVDRYPLPGIKEMDASFTERHAGQIPFGLQWLARRIDDYYAAMVLPELVIVLKLSPEIAVRRQPGDNPESVARRAEEIQQATFSDSNVVLLNTEPPLDKVVSDLKKIVWGWL